MPCYSLEVRRAPKSDQPHTTRHHAGTRLPRRTSAQGTILPDVLTFAAHHRVSSCPSTEPSSFLADKSGVAEDWLQASDAATYKVKATAGNGIHVAGSEADQAHRLGEEQELR